MASKTTKDISGESIFSFQKEKISGGQSFFFQTVNF